MTEEPIQKKKHTLRNLFVGAILLAAVAIGVGTVYIDSIARAGVETGATYALGVDTKLGSMNIGIVSGSVAMAGLEVSNPPGFEAEHFLVLGDGKVAVSLGSLMEDKVVVPELTLAGLTMNLERRGGKANYKPILDNLKKFESADQAPAPAEQARGESKKFVISKLSIKDITVNVEMLPLGGELSRIPVKIAGLELTDVGSDAVDGVELAMVVDIVIKAIMQALVENTGHLLPGDIAGELQSGLAGLNALGENAAKLVGDVTGEAGKVVGELGKAGEALTKDLQQGAKDAEKSVKEIGQGLGNLLGDKKDEKTDGD